MEGRASAAFGPRLTPLSYAREKAGCLLELFEFGRRERVSAKADRIAFLGSNELDDVDGEVSGDGRQDIDPDVRFTAFDLANVLVLVAYELGQLLLRQAM